MADEAEGAGVCECMERLLMWPSRWVVGAGDDDELMEQGDICDDPNCTSMMGDWSMESGVSSADGLKLPKPASASSGEDVRCCDLCCC